MLTHYVAQFNKIGSFSIPITRFWFVSISQKIGLGKENPETPVATEEKKASF